MNEEVAAVERALVELAAGRAVVVVDDEDRENEGDLIFAAQMATPELVSFMVRYTSGYICVALTEDECDRLDLPPMHHTNSDSFRTAFTVALIPTTLAHTTLGALAPGDTVNLEVDVVAKYVERLVGAYGGAGHGPGGVAGEQWTVER